MSEVSDSIKKKQFLIVDDYETMRILVKTDLQKLGISKVFVSKSGNEALNIIKSKLGTSEQVEFVITDMMMPDGTGLELTKGIRAIPELKKLPILMVSSIAEMNHIIECAKAGINDYIVKPWEIEDLSKKISLLGK
ncbi:MAG: response regulator [Bacteriovoracaceae bacterium]